MKLKKWLILFLILICAFLLAGCSKAPITAHSHGFFDGFVIYQFSRFIIFLSKLCNHSYALGIIAITFIVKFALMPLSFITYKNGQKNQSISSKYSKIEKRYSTIDVPTLEKLYSKRHQLRMNTKSQHPILVALTPSFAQCILLLILYQAVSRTYILRTGTFFSIQMSKADPYFILPTIATLLTFLEQVFSDSFSHQKMGKISWIILFGYPAFILLSSYSVPAVIVLYWIALYSTIILQTIIFHLIIVYKNHHQKNSNKIS